ncbi:MAG: protein kinase, partial [Polyangiaceae bacterium]|nr:protein kinase [Polyangiaceae bacterium]
FEVVHRDLKPENMFVGRAADGSDVIKLLDFGIARSMQDARLTGVGEVFGTPQYMAPERITSIDAGPSADLYALGIIFFEMLTTQLPFDAPDIPSFFIKHMKEAPPKVRSIAPEVPEALEALIDALLKKDPKQRPVDAHAVHNELVAICRQIGAKVPTETMGATPSSREPARTLPPVALDRWVHRTAVFEQMLQRAYGGAAPPELVGLLGEVRAHVQRITELRAGGLGEQRKLEQVEDKEREGRQRFGFAMDALGVDASHARQHARAAGEGMSALAAELEQGGASLQGCLREILSWEGRSGFQEPYAQLSEAYRRAADVNDRWLDARKRERQARAALEERERLVTDLEFQIHELRGAQSRFEQSIEAEKGAQAGRIVELGKQADTMEAELVALASRFCAPLRGRAELAPFFKELEDPVAA